MVQQPSACNAWSHTCHPFRESFKEFPIKSLINSLSWRHKFLVCDPLTVKKTNKHRFEFGFGHSCFLGREEFAVCHSQLWRFVSGSYSKIHDSTCDNATEELCLPFKAAQKIKTHILPIGLLLNREFLWNHLGAHFSHVQILC